MSKQIDALKMALDLATIHHTDDGYDELRSKVRQLAKEALMSQGDGAQQSNEQVEPVAWIDSNGNIDCGLDAILNTEGWIPLYTTPPQRNLLTDADYVNACMSYRHDFGLMTEDQRKRMIYQAREWARAFGMNEAAHGIHPTGFKDKNNG